MAVKIFSLKGVPEDEAEDIRELLENNAVDFYETPGGNWGISMPALWIKDENEKERVKTLIDVYEKAREERGREAFVKEQEEGRTRSMLDVFLAQPLQLILYFLAVLAIGYLSLKPFVGFVDNP